MRDSRRCVCSWRAAASSTRAGSARGSRLRTRLIVLKADGSIAVHSDAKAYKPLNWMSPPCRDRARRRPRSSRRTPKGETLRVELHEVLHDYAIELGDDPGSRRTASRPSSRSCIAARVAALREDLRLVRREYPTDIGPVDLLCRDGDGRAVVVEVKRVGEIAGVEQLLRYQERLDRDPQLRADPRACSSPSGSSPRPRCSPRAGASPASRSTWTPSATASTTSRCSEPVDPGKLVCQAN